MRLLANLLIALSLAAALVAASSAYLVDLARPDAELVGLTLNETVQRIEADGIQRADVAKKGMALDAAILDALRAAEAGRVRVEEFALARWEQRWIFLLALVGLGAGAFGVRRANAAVLAEADRAGGAQRVSPAGDLAAIAGIVEESLRTWDGGAPAQAVLERLSVAIDEHGPAFVGARDVLVARMGLGAYASLMDRFAAAERQIHRAWSAAADGVLEETYECLGRARVMLEETRALLR